MFFKCFRSIPEIEIEDTISEIINDKYDLVINYKGGDITMTEIIELITEIKVTYIERIRTEHLHNNDLLIHIMDILNTSTYTVTIFPTETKIDYSLSLIPYSLDFIQSIFME